MSSKVDEPSRPVSRLSRYMLAAPSTSPSQETAIAIFAAEPTVGHAGRHAVVGLEVGPALHRQRVIVEFARHITQGQVQAGHAVEALSSLTVMALAADLISPTAAATGCGS